MRFCKASFVGGSWWHWMFLIYKTKGIVPHSFHQLTGKSRQHIWHLLHQERGHLECQKISTTLQSVLRTLTRSAEPVKLLNSTTRSIRFGVFHLTTYMMSCVNDTTRLLDAFDISTFKFEMSRADWSSVRTQTIKLCKKIGMITDCSFMKLPVGAMELTT